MKARKAQRGGKSSFARRSFNETGPMKARKGDADTLDLISRGIASMRPGR